MFFSISKTTDSRFPCSHSIGRWMFNHDAGWIKNRNSWTKGYRYEDIGHGNFCEIVFDNDSIELRHDRERSFPLWWDDQHKILTNCLGSGQRLWTDDQIMLDRDGAHFSKKDIIGELELAEISLAMACRKIQQNLDHKFDCLKADPTPKKIFLSGGVDTLSLYSQAKTKGIDVEYINYEFFYYDHFTNHFMQQIKEQHWAYRQVHHWTEPCFLIAGSCGDEYQFRGPLIIAMWMAWHDIDFLRQLEKSAGYHKNYFMLEKNAKIFEYQYHERANLQKQYPEKHLLIRHLIDINLNDHQHWHLGHTLTWTPFKDIEIFKTLANVHVQELLEQCIDAKLTRSLIDSQYQHMLSRQKNYLTRTSLP